jgi:drug/metabolite transporter (DMT)-like permease
MSGMTLFFVDRLSAGSLIGNITAILSGVAFAWLVLTMRKQKNESPIESIIIGNLLTAVIGLPFMFGSVPSLESIYGLMLLGIFQLGLSYIFYSTAIKHVTAIEGILIPVLEPILNPVWVLLIVGEKPSYWAIIGGIVVISSVTLRSLFVIMKRKLV